MQVTTHAKDAKSDYFCDQNYLNEVATDGFNNEYLGGRQVADFVYGYEEQLSQDEYPSL